MQGRVKKLAHRKWCNNCRFSVMLGLHGCKKGPVYIFISSWTVKTLRLMHCHASTYWNAPHGKCMSLPIYRTNWLTGSMIQLPWDMLSFTKLSRCCTPSFGEISWFLNNVKVLNDVRRHASGLLFITSLQTRPTWCFMWVWLVVRKQGGLALKHVSVSPFIPYIIYMGPINSLLISI